MLHRRKRELECSNCISELNLHWLYTLRLSCPSGRGSFQLPFHQAPRIKFFVGDVSKWPLCWPEELELSGFTECMQLQKPEAFMYICAWGAGLEEEMRNLFKFQERVKVNHSKPLLRGECQKLTHSWGFIQTVDKGVTCMVWPQFLHGLDGQSVIGDPVCRLTTACSSVTLVHAHHDWSKSYNKKGCGLFFIPPKMTRKIDLSGKCMLINCTVRQITLEFHLGITLVLIAFSNYSQTHIGC